MNLIFVALVYVYSCSSSLLQVRANHVARLVFMAPANHIQSQHTMNTRIENLMPGLFANGKQEAKNLVRGWHVEAFKKQTFTMYMLVNTTFLAQFHGLSNSTHVFYVFFTLDKSSCADFLNHTHIPVTLDAYKSRRRLHKAQLEFSLAHDVANSVYYVCLSSHEENVFIHQGSENRHVIIFDSI